MKNTKIKQSVIDILKDQRMTLQLALKLGVGERSIQNHVSDNLPYGRLTDMDALEAIGELTGKKILDIIESEETTANNLTEDVRA
jgi:hypothetical protein